MTRVAYLISEYPAPSHTFIRREIAALRIAGMDIVTFSVRPSRGEPASEIDRLCRQETQTVLGHSAWTYLAVLISTACASPLRTIAVFRLALGHRGPGIRAFLWAIFHFIEAVYLAKLLRKAQVTRLHSHFANSGATVGMLAAHLIAVPWSLTLHGVSETDYPAGLLLGDKVARADFVACASWFMRAQAMRHASPDNWRKLHIVRCGVDLAAMPIPGSTEGPIRFICVGRLSPEKGHRGLFDAFAAMRTRETDVFLELVGGGPLDAELRGFARELGIEESLKFHGPLSESETLKCIAAADILVLPSLMEGLPLVIMEAMALGKPVIASGVAGIPELVHHEENGLLFPASHWRALADAMLRFAADANIRKSFGSAGRAAVTQEFAIDQAIRPLISLFSDRQPL